METKQELNPIDVELEVFKNEIERQRNFCNSHVVPKLKTVGDNWFKISSVNKSFVFNKVKLIIDNFIYREGYTRYRRIRVKYHYKTVFKIIYASNSWSIDCIKEFHQCEWMESIPALVDMVTAEIDKELVRRELALKKAKLQYIKEELKSFESRCE